MNNRQNLILRFSNDFELNVQKIESEFDGQGSWEARYRAIMLLGKILPKLERELQLDESLVQGCESKVWLNTCWQKDSIHIAASSDAKIVKGLVAIVLAAYDKKTKNEILEFDIQQLFDTLKLSKNLSPSRTNGLFAMVETIKRAALDYESL